MKKTADFLNRYWVVKTIFSFLPSVWLPFIVAYIGPTIGLLDDNRKLTPPGLFLTVVVYLLSLGTLIVSGYWTNKDKKNQDKFEANKKALESTKEFYHQILSSLNICNANQNKTAIKAIPSIQCSKELTKSFEILSKDKLSNLVQDVRTCFHELTAIPQDKIIVTVAYSFDDENWEWADIQAAKNGLTLADLVNNPSTTFYEVLHSQTQFVYHNSKICASTDGHYAFDQFDSRHRNVGSIVCWKIPVNFNDGMKIAKLVVSISSYGHCFEKGTTESQTVTDSIKFLFDVFEEPLAAELINMKLYQKTLSAAKQP